MKFRQAKEGAIKLGSIVGSDDRRKEDIMLVIQLVDRSCR
jgi:hypothetical protein